MPPTIMLTIKSILFSFCIGLHLNLLQRRIQNIYFINIYEMPMITLALPGYVLMGRERARVRVIDLIEGNAEHRTNGPGVCSRHVHTSTNKGSG